MKLQPVHILRERDILYFGFTGSHKVINVKLHTYERNYYLSQFFNSSAIQLLFNMNEPAVTLRILGHTVIEQMVETFQMIEGA